MNFAIVVPARKGSKTLKNKNLSPLKNIPLAEHTFKSIKKIKYPKYILSNDEKLKKISRKYKINYQYERPEQLSKDKTSLIDTLQHFITWLENQKNHKIDTLVILQVTSPLRTRNDIIKAINHYKKNEFKSLFSVSESQEHPYETVNILKKNKWKYILPKGTKFYRRQDYDLNSFFINGAIYIIDIKFLKKYKKLVSKNHGIFFMNKINSIDIDDKEDLIIASKLI